MLIGLLTQPNRLVFDRDTGKPKGYGFCEFAGELISFPLLRKLF